MATETARTDPGVEAAIQNPQFMVPRPTQPPTGNTNSHQHPDPNPDEGADRDINGFIDSQPNRDSAQHAHGKSHKDFNEYTDANTNHHVHGDAYPFVYTNTNSSPNCHPDSEADSERIRRASNRHLHAAGPSWPRPLRSGN